MDCTGQHHGCRNPLLIHGGKTDQTAVTDAEFSDDGLRRGCCPGKQTYSIRFLAFAFLATANYVSQMPGLFYKRRDALFRDLQDLSDFDEVRIAQLILIGLEDFHIFVRVAQKLFCYF